MNRPATYIKTLLATAISILPACSGEGYDSPDSPVGGEPGKGVTVIVSGKESRDATRADNLFGEPEEWEKIKTWWVAFVDDESHMVMAIEGNTLDESSVSDRKTVSIPDGKYTLYAFANISDDLLKNRSGLSFTKGEKVSITTGETVTPVADGEAIISAVWKGMERNPKVGSGDGFTYARIPMTGYLKDVEVRNGIAYYKDGKVEELTVEIIRMLAKVQFEFTNNSLNPVTVVNIRFSPAAEGDLPLFHYPSVPATSPGILTTGVTNGNEISCDVNRELAKGGSDNSCSFYLREVISGHSTGRFPIYVTLKKGSGEEAREETVSALLNELTYINRNDRILVPLAISDYSLSLDVEFYPPIGGYPPVRTSANNSETEYYVEFGTGGWFAIHPTVKDNDGNRVAQDRIAISICKDENDKDMVSAPDLFSRQPKVDVYGSLTACIKDDAGNGKESVVTLEISVSEKNGSGDMEKKVTFKRKFYIIKKK